MWPHVAKNEILGFKNTLKFSRGISLVQSLELKIILRSRTSSYPFFRGHPCEFSCGREKSSHWGGFLLGRGEKTRERGAGRQLGSRLFIVGAPAEVPSLSSPTNWELRRAPLHLARIIRSIIKLINYLFFQRLTKAFLQFSPDNCKLFNTKRRRRRTFRLVSEVISNDGSWASLWRHDKVLKARTSF